MGDIWREWGHEVEVLYGLARPVTGDVVFLHIDLSVVPPEYTAAVAGHPCVVNRAVTDVSKTSYSRLQVRSPEDWDGPVIVKTVLNYGGLPERRLARARPVGHLLDSLQRFVPWERRRHISWNAYRVFPSARDVPRAVYRNRHLFVERLVTEQHNGVYHTRNYIFLGDHYYNEVYRGPRPVVKGPEVYDRTPCPVHPGIQEEVRRRRFDYGKFDYVVNNGEHVLFDMNHTPGIYGSPERKRTVAKALAGGLYSLVR
jgi:hypothetical protein